MNTAFQLFQIQQIDTEIDHADHRLQQIEDAISNNATISKAEKKVEVCKHELILKTNHFNEINDEIEKKKIKKNQSQSSLYSGKVQNPKELEDLQHEITSLDKTIITLEDALMQALIAVDASEEGFAEAKENLKKSKSMFATEMSMLEAEKESLLQKIDGAMKKRTPIFEQIDSAHRKQYEALRRRKNGIAVTILKDDSCGACGSNLTASQRQTARSATTLFICPNCGRIIYGSS